MDKLVILAVLLILGQSCQEISPSKTTLKQVKTIKTKTNLKQQKLVKAYQKLQHQKDSIATEKHIVQYNDLKDNIKAEINLLNLDYLQEFSEMLTKSHFRRFL